MAAACVAAVALAATVALLPAAQAATGSTVVGATVPSATSLAIDPAGAAPNGCETGVAGVTDFGTVLADSSRRGASAA